MAASKVNSELVAGCLEGLQRISENTKCADCQKSHPAWATVTFGFFICYECSAKHRLLGPNLSRVKNVTMDRWSPEEVRRMYVGGNKYAYKIPKEGDTVARYQGCRSFVEDLDRRCEISAQKEPGESFMEPKAGPAAEPPVRPAVKKTPLQRFGRAGAAAAEETAVEPAESAFKAPMAAPKHAEEAPEAKPRQPLVMSRAMFGRAGPSINMKSSTISADRSPFSFDVETPEDSEDS